MSEAAIEPQDDDTVEPHKGGRPPGHSNAETLARRRKVARLLATQGAMSATAISDMLGISLSTATRDLAAIKAAWREEMIEDVEAMLARDIAELGMVKQEAWRVYAKSVEEGLTVVTEQDTPGGMIVTTTTTDPKPDLNALKMVQSCIEKKRKLLGLDKEDTRDKGPKAISFTVRIGDRVLVSESSTAEPDDIVDAEVVELDSTGKALPSGDQGK